MDRIELICCNQEVLDLILKGDKAISEHLKLTVPEDWSTFGPQSFEYTLEQISSKPSEQEWWMYLAVLKDSRILVGSGGYKGTPNENGEVEIGYEVAPSFEGRGIATEMTGLFTAKAFGFIEVKVVVAHTLAEENASTKVLLKNRFSFIKEIEDEEEGNIWRWELKK